MNTIELWWSVHETQPNSYCCANENRQITEKIRRKKSEKKINCHVYCAMSTTNCAFNWNGEKQLSHKYLDAILVSSLRVSVVDLLMLHNRNNIVLSSLHSHPETYDGVTIEFLDELFFSIFSPCRTKRDIRISIYNFLVYTTKPYISIAQKNWKFIAWIKLNVAQKNFVSDKNNSFNTFFSFPSYTERCFNQMVIFDTIHQFTVLRSFYCYYVFITVLVNVVLFVSCGVKIWYSCR